MIYQKEYSKIDVNRKMLNKNILGLEKTFKRYIRLNETYVLLIYIAFGFKTSVN